MDILIQQTEEIKQQLEISMQLLNNTAINSIISQKIGIINDKLLEISATLTKLNINIKLDNQILLTNEETEYLDNEKKTNKLITKVMPALAVFSLIDN